MFNVLPILADSDPTMKIIVGVIVFVIWGIGALAKLAKKPQQSPEEMRRQQEALERAMLEQMEMQTRRRVPAPPPLPPALQPQRPAVRRPVGVAKQKKVQPKPQQKRRLVAQAPPPIPHVTPAVLESEIGQRIVPASPANRQGVARPMASRLQLWLTPKTLQQQFILTEIFQPPLALRDKRGTLL